MPARVPVGQQQWEGYHVACKPLELGGVDRRLFGLLMIVFMVFWQGMGSFLLAVVSSVALYMFFRYLTKADPQFFSVLRQAARFPAAWYDPAATPSEFGPYLTSDPDEYRRLQKEARRRIGDQRKGWFSHLPDLLALVFPAKS